MKTFHNFSKYGPTEIVIEPDGQVWVSTVPKPDNSFTWWGEYEKIEVLRGKDYRRGGNSERDGGGSGRTFGATSGRYPRKPESKYGIRDHHPVDPRMAEQARLYMQMYKDDKTGAFRHLFNGPIA